MFSKKTLVIVGVIFLITANLFVLHVSTTRYSSHGFGRIALFIVAPFQEIVSDSVRFARGVWENYFALADAAIENAKLKSALQHEVAKNSRQRELELSNIRLRKLLAFKSAIAGHSIAAEVVGKDPSSWYQAVVINKGSKDGVEKGMPVVVPEGIAGQVTTVSSHYAKVILIIDRNSAVDAMVQDSRARGIIQGESSNRCVFKYVLRKDEVAVGEKIVASGLDGVFPKGLHIGKVTGVVRRVAGIFQEVTVTPYIDFEKLEEVLVLPAPQKPDFVEP
jgi:rod shape-determining protein MreC